jgi:ribonucleoside-diphosphate reductase alpha chain
MSVAITSKIVGVSVKKADETAAPVTPIVEKPADVNPLWVRIDSRPDGTLEAVSEKICYSTSEGRKKVYVLVSFLPVDGIMDGAPITIERPIEFFFPVGQQSSEHQWITATMRNLSLAARGGYVTQALADLRKVVWDKGPVRCGTNEWGKPIFHDSEVAAIAWSIQQILQKRGFVDVDGNQVPAKVAARNYAKRFQRFAAEEAEELVELPSPEYDAVEAPAPVSNSKAIGTCGACGSDTVLMDGCETCTGCGNSKCG